MNVYIEHWNSDKNSACNFCVRRVDVCQGLASIYIGGGHFTPWIDYLHSNAGIG